jgi:hypothetical protein
LLKNNELEIVTELPAEPQMQFDWSAEPSLGRIMSFVCGPLLDGVVPEQRAVIEKALADGRWSWMFDGEGKFIENGDDD